MATIAIYSIKGGVGKTATAVNIAYTAVQDGYKSILIDLDPQGSASFYFRVKSSKKYSSKIFLAGGKKIGKNIKGTDYERLDSLPASLSYRKMDLHLDSYKHSRTRLAKLLQPLQKEYPFIFVDCPPNITLVSENVFRAADILLVPLIPTTLSILTYEKLTRFFKKRKLDESKIIPFFSMAEKRKKLHRDIMQQIVSQEQRMLNTYIPYTVDVENMGIYRQPVACFKPHSPVVESYLNLWREVKEKIT